MNKVLVSGSILVVVIIVYIIYYSKQESFFVAYNNFMVPINKQDSLDESDIRYLNSVFDEYNTGNFPDIFTNQYTKYSNSKFDLQTVFDKAVTDKLNDIFSKQDKYKGDKIKVVGDIYDLYWKDVGEDRYYVFKINITDETKKWTRSFKIYLIKNTSGIYIKTISLEQSSEYLSVGGIEKDDYKNYYMIRNTLHLMDPYLTSRKDMIISDKMKYNFEKILRAKEKTKI